MPGDIDIHLERFESDNGIALFKISTCGSRGIWSASSARREQGKSTLLNLIQRFADPSGPYLFTKSHYQNGRWELICVNNLLMCLRPYLFSLSVADNIALGRPDATRNKSLPPQSWLKLDRDIKAYLQGYQTPVGERGITLSGGQNSDWRSPECILTQRPYLLLDDALSAVDAKPPPAFCGICNLPVTTMTLLMVTSLQGSRTRDQILVLEQGEQRIRKSSDIC